MTASPVRLPTWYAGFAPAGTGALDRLTPLGPFLLAPDASLETATFGRPESAGAVLFEGYLFERACLIRELGLDTGVSGAEIAAAAFARWGDRIFERLDGSYLLAVWDPDRQRLLLGHDALGHHPVYYASADGVLWFGSNVLRLASCGRISRRVNRVSLALSALVKWPAQGETFFEEIRRLKPGNYLSFSRDLTARPHLYFTPWPAEGEPELTEREVRDQFEPALVSAVSRCMELTPSGIMLSGGLDSVTIAALAVEFGRAHGSPPVTAVSGRLDDVYAGEEPMQDATASALGMAHVVARESEWTGGRNEIELSLEVVSELPAPSRIYWVGGYMAFYRFTAAHHIQVLLSGAGGDNWVSVSNAYAAESMRRWRFGQLRRFVRSYIDTGGLSPRAAADALLWSGGLRVLLDARAARMAPHAKAAYHRWRSRKALPEWLCPDPSLHGAVADALLAQRPPSLTPDGRVPANYLRHEQRTVVNPYYEYEFEQGFHIEAACGLRILSPYHDKRLVTFLNRVPPEVLLQGARYKGLLRPVAERRLPGLGLNAQRKTYGPGVASAHMASLKAGMARVWPGRPLERLHGLGVIDAFKARTVFEGIPERTFGDLLSMYVLLSADAWLGSHAPS